MIPLIVVDRNVVFRQALSQALTAGRSARVVLEYDHPDAMEPGLFPHEMHVLLLDLDFLEPGMLNFVGQVIQSCERTRVLGLSQSDDTGIYSSLIAAGIQGVAQKTDGLDSLVESIKKVHEGQLLFSNEVLQSILDHDDEQKVIPRLFSSRELQIIDLICEENSNEEIADRLFLSTSTIKWHRHNIMTKSNTQSALSLYKYAAKNGLISNSVRVRQISL
jgi:DNA-binding NarL/FixJ family response regulator